MACVLTLLYVVVLAAMIYFSTTSANLGILARQDAGGRWVVTWVMPAGLSYDAGVRPGDVVVSLNGVSVDRSGQTSQPQTNFYGAKHIEIFSKEGRLISTSTGGKDGGNPFQRWAYAVLGLVFIGVGGPVYIKARQRSAATAFYAFCIATAFALAVVIAAAQYHDWTLVLMFVSLILWSATFAIFFFTFPTRLGKTATQQTLVILAILAVGLALIVLYGRVLMGNLSDYDWVLPLANIYAAGCVAAGLIHLSWSLVAERSREIRQQLVLLLVGTALAVGPTLLLNIFPRLLFGRQILHGETAALALGIMPLAFAYAITQHQLLGIRNFVRRSVVYVIMGSVMLLTFSMAAALLSTVLTGDWTKQELGLIGFGFFVFLMALSFGYVQRRVERLVDKYIYHDAYDYKEALLEFSTQLAAEQNPHLLAEQLVERTCRLMNLTCGVLLLAVRPDEEYGVYKLRSDFSGLTTIELNELQTDGIAPAKEHLEQQAVRVQEQAYEQSRTEDQKRPFLMVFARYGDYADLLVRGLEAELGRLGIRLQNSVAPAQMSPSNSAHHSQANSFTLTPSMTRVLYDGLEGGSALHDTAGTRTMPINIEPSVLQANHIDHTTSNTGSADIESVRSFLGVPLWTRSRFVGMLCLGGKRTGERFSKDDLALLSTLGSQAALAIYNAQLYEMREQALLDTITALAHAIEAKDNYTINHCERITFRAVALAQTLALPQQEIENIRLGSILHDVGKIGIPDAILNKPGKLTSEEYEIIKQHAAIGARIVQSVGALQEVAPIVRHHQERYDGTGYPDGLAGEDIPIGARIIAVVDAYGAMTEDRVYRKALGHHAAIAELRRCAGTQFDPVIVDAFIRLLEDRPDLVEQ